MTIHRRLACPSLAAPLRTGDGWLARLPPLARPLTPAHLAALAEAAGRHGNGQIEISKRGNLQLRGLASPDATALAADLAAAGLVLGEGIPISSDPLADPILAEPFVADLHRRLAETGIGARLAAKLSLVLDLGTATAPLAIAADLRLAFRDGMVQFGLGGTHASARWIGAVPSEEAAAAALDVLTALAVFGPEARLAGERGLRDDPAFLAAIGVTTAVPPPRAAAIAPAVGPIDTLVMPARGIAFPFGQADAAALSALADAAAASGILAFAPAPERALLLAGPEGAIAAAAAASDRLGFITDAADPRRFISACIGSPGCASGTYPARALARAAAPRLGSLLDGSLTMHFSGCGKGCAHPEPATITLSGIDKGAAFVLDGRARDAAIGFASPEKLVERLQALSAMIRSGEIAGVALGRMGRDGIARAMTGEASVGHDGEQRLSA